MRSVNNFSVQNWIKKSRCFVFQFLICCAVFFLPRCDHFHCLAVPPSSSSLNHFISHLPHWASNIVNITLYVLLFLAHVERYLSYAKPSICFPFTLSHAICHRSCSLFIPPLCSRARVTSMLAYVWGSVEVQTQNPQSSQLSTTCWF